MSYAVLQKTLDRPDTDRLRRAFVKVPGLTAADAHILGNDAFGILVKRFPYEQAYALKNALAVESIETEIVDEAALPELPAAKHITRLDPKENRLLVYDPLGRPFPLEWKHISLIAAGVVRVQQTVRVEPDRPVAKLPELHGLFSKYPRGSRTHEVRTEQHFLDFVVGEGLQRCNLIAEQASPQTFSFLADRRTGDVVTDWRLLALEFIERAPQAITNRGALMLKDAGTEDLVYPTRNAYQEELVWILWRLRQATASGS